jgi:hypothetical protein
VARGLQLTEIERWLRSVRRTLGGSSPIRAKSCGSVLCAMLRGRLTGVELSSSSPPRQSLDAVLGSE